MPIGTQSDMKVYEQTFNSGFIEKLSQNIKGFNAASGGTITLKSNALPGDFDFESFYRLVQGMSRRDPNSTALQDPKKLLMDENISVKLNWKFDRFEMTEDAFYKAGRSTEEFAMYLGEQQADQAMAYMLNRAVGVVSAALSGVDGVNVDVSGGGSGTFLSYKNLNKVLRLYGDRQNAITQWVMAGAGVNDLANDMFGEAAFNDSGVSIYNGGAPSLGRPILAIDSPALMPEGKFVVLGLTKGAVAIEESEPVRSIFERTGGRENIVIGAQAEGAFNVQVKGFKWDTQNGGVNPDDATLNTASNWDRNLDSIKDLAGVRLVVAQEA